MNSFLYTWVGDSHFECLLQRLSFTNLDLEPDCVRLGLVWGSDQSYFSCHKSSFCSLKLIIARLLVFLIL